MSKIKKEVERGGGREEAVRDKSRQRWSGEGQRIAHLITQSL